MDDLFISRKLDALLPAYLDVPCILGGNAEFLSVIGLLSPYTFPAPEGRLIERGNQWPLHQPRDTNPLTTIRDWNELQEHYLTLRSMAVSGSNDALTDLGWLWLNTSNSSPERKHPVSTVLTSGSLF